MINVVMVLENVVKVTVAVNMDGVERLINIVILTVVVN
jgi:hypothetical protein